MKSHLFSSSSADFSLFKLLLLSDKFDPCCPQRKDLCYSWLDANECACYFSIRTDHYGTTFISRRAPRRDSIPSGSSNDISALHARDVSVVGCGLPG